MILSTAVLILILAFAAFSIDVGYIALSKGQLQNAVDAAALAAVQELNPHVNQALVATSATQVANEIAGMHRAGDHDSVSVNGNLGSVQLGRRIYDSSTGEYEYLWGPEAAPYNLVKVTAERKEIWNGDSLLEDNQLPLFFGAVLGSRRPRCERRPSPRSNRADIMLVLDYSASMNDDSELSAIGTLGQTAVESNIQQMWQDLGSPTYGNMTFSPNWVTIPGQPASGDIPHVKVTWKNTEIHVVSSKDLSNVVMEFSNGNHQKIEDLLGMTGTFKGSGSNNGLHIKRCWIKSGSNFSTDGSGYGERFDFYSDSQIRKGLGLSNVAYPYPSGSWEDYISYARSSSDHEAAGYRYKFGMLTLINYWNKNQPGHDQTPDLWKARQQPITALKDSVDVLADYLLTVSADDNVGLSVYTYPDSAGAKLELGLGSTLSQVKTISRQRQAGHYDQYTNIGAGMRIARLELEANKRPKALQMMILMTDGLPNRTSTSASPTQFSIDEANLALASDIKIFTVSLGARADAGLMQQIADITGGEHFNVPGGASVAEYAQDLKEIFGKIASDRPLKLIPVP